jgi:hypothetical protein
MSGYAFHSVKDKDMTVKLRLRYKRTGPGEPGEKSAGLDRFKKLTDSTVTGPRNTWKERGLVSLPKGVITPDYFRRFLKRVGASHDNPKSADAIFRSAFSKEDKEGIKHALHPFDDAYIALRSDECTAAGCGLWHTGFLGYNRRTFKQALEQIKEILASEFSPSVIAFKKRTGLPMEKTPGVLIQPMVLSDYSMLEDVFTTPLHIIAITRFSGERCLVNFGTGINGANKIGAQAMMLDDLSESSMSEDALRMALRNSTILLDGRIARILSFSASAVMRASIKADVVHSADHIISELKSALGKITKGNPEPLYLELASWFPTFAVLQCAEIKLGKVERPDVRWNQKILSLYSPTGRQFGSLVSGRRVVETENLIYIPRSNGRVTDQLKLVAAFNNLLTDYVLLSGLPYEVLNNHLTFAGFSNASAMAFTEDCNPLYPVSTHFGGVMREAGIPVIAGKVNDSFVRSLKPGLNRRKVLVYANDEIQDGFMAAL